MVKPLHVDGALVGPVTIDLDQVLPRVREGDIRAEVERRGMTFDETDISDFSAEEIAEECARRGIVSLGDMGVRSIDAADLDLAADYWRRSTPASRREALIHLARAIPDPFSDIADALDVRE